MINLLLYSRPLLIWKNTSMSNSLDEILFVFKDYDISTAGLICQGLNNMVKDGTMIWYGRNPAGITRVIISNQDVSMYRQKNSVTLVFDLNNTPYEFE